jgi:hypothetical protein
MESLGWFLYLDGTSVLKPLWGIDSGNAMTCCHSAVLKNAQPTYATELTSGTIRWQYAFLHTTGPMVTTPMVFARVGSAFNVFNSNEFGCYVLINPNGSVSVQVLATTTISPGYTEITSAPGVFALNGTYHAFQLRFTFISHTVFQFKIVINDVIVLDSSASTSMPDVSCDDEIPTGPATFKSPWYRIINPAVGAGFCSNIAEIAGINDVRLFNRQYAVNTMSSFVELVIDDSPSAVSYLPGNAPKLKVDTCTGGTPDPPGPAAEVQLSQLPIELVLVELDHSGLYFPTPSSPPGLNFPSDEPHDKYYNRDVPLPGPGSVDKKIPDPTIRTALFGE